MENQHHYFASCGLGWATDETRDAAIQKCVNCFRREFKEMTKGAQKQGEIGGYLWTCKVNAPATEKYAIEFYAPKGVEIEHGRNHFTTYVTNKEIRYFTEGQDK